MSKQVAAFLLLACVFLSSCAQILLKVGSRKKYNGVKQYFNIYIIVGYGIFFGMTLCSTYLYRYLTVVVGSMLDSFGYVFVSILSVVILQEDWQKKKTIGMCLILLGTSIAILF